MLNGKGRGRAGRGTIADMGDGPSPPEPATRILCFGGATVDRTYAAERPIRPGTSNPAAGSQSFGGVAHNVAVNLARLGVATSLVSVVGDDESGRELIRHLGMLGIDAAGVTTAAGRRTAEYAALLEPDRSLAVGMADMAIFDMMTVDPLASALSRLAPAAWIFADCNLPSPVLQTLIAGPVRGSARLAIDAVSTPKVERLPADLGGIDLLFLNHDEASALLGSSTTTLPPEAALRQLQDRGVPRIVLTLGAEGLLLADDNGDIHAVPAVPAEVVDVTGAGDAAIATALAFELAGRPSIEAVRWGTLAAALTIEQPGSAHPALSMALLDRCRDRIAALRLTAVHPEHDNEQDDITY